MRSMKKVFVILALLIFQQAAAGETPGREWKINASAGSDISGGNSEVAAMSIDLNATVKSGSGTFAASTSLNYAEADRTVARRNSKTTAKFSRSISDRVYWFLQTEYEYDKIALLDYRSSAGLGIGCFIISSGKTTWKLDSGITHIDQQLRDPSLENPYDNILALKISETLETAVSDSAKLWHSAEFIPNSEKLSTYLLNLDLGVATAITGNSSLRLSFSFKRNNAPPEEIEKNDYSVKAAIGFAFGNN